MKLYHGSNLVIDRIDLNRSSAAKDFGCGFYLSPDYSQAQRMAETRVAREQTGVPLVTTFEFDDSELEQNGLKVLRFDTYSQAWADFVFANRNNESKSNLHDYDIVIGPIADDRIGLQISRLLKRLISREMFLEEIKFIKPTFQYFFATGRALERLSKI